MSEPNPFEEQQQSYEGLCVLCREPTTDDLSEVTKGLQTLIDFSDTRGKKELHDYLLNQQQLKASGHEVKVLVHKSCRRDFVNKRRSTQNETESEDSLAKKQRLTSLRSKTDTFNWKEHCFFCGNPVKCDLKHPDRNDFRLASTLPFRNNVVEFCTEKRNDQWADEVKKRIINCLDFVHAEARYHKSCHSKFFTYKDLSGKKKPGRKENERALANFNILSQWLEVESELHTLSEVKEKMTEIADNEDDVYSVRWLKEKLKVKYGEYIFFANVEGRADVVCFKQLAGYLINEQWYLSKKQNTEDEAQRIIQLAAKLILGDIRAMEFDNTHYPTNKDIWNLDGSKKWLPDSLQQFLSVIIKSTVKQNSIGQSIVFSSRPKSSILPIPFGLGIEMDHVFGSRWLITELNRLGFSIGYNEVTRYKQSVVQNENNLDTANDSELGFTQWVADNVDHNVATLDGTGTFHGMGIISVSTGNGSFSSDLTPLKRLPLLKAADIAKNKGIPIVSFIRTEGSGFASLTYKPLIQLHFPYTLPAELYSNLIWHSAYFFTTHRPSWSGYMQNISNGHYPGKSNVKMLPIIDLNPSDETCLYSTLMFIIKQAEQLNVTTPCLTFDQPLWIKALEIIKLKSLNVVCRLGGFHTLMSFLGSVGAVMKGSGLSDALEMIYGPNAVIHMISGKAIARALRGHFLVEAALMIEILRPLFPNQAELEVGYQFQEESDDEGDVNIEEQVETNLNKLTTEEVEEIERLCTFVEESSNTDVILESNVINRISNYVQLRKEELSSQSRTAKLWIQYLDYVDVMKMFVRAERTGNWSLHLIATSRMINLFAATAHLNYAKSARLYLQLMLELPADYPWVYQSFIEHGYHTVRRSDRFWSGLWTDLTIEQVMMRSIKSRGGLTRGRGMTETVRLIWIHSMHRCADIHNGMSTLTGAQHKTSEQHIELGESRIRRDNVDLKKLMSWFNQYNPFTTNDTKLRSLSSGLTASDDDHINCDEAETIGLRMHHSLNNVSVNSATLKRNDQVRTLESLQSPVKIGKQNVQIDPMLLFNRLILMAQREDDIASCFNYELTPSPETLFKDGLMRKPNKAMLKKAMTQNVEPCEPNITTEIVIDGGALLHKVKWIPNSTYQQIVNQYLRYVQKKYGKACVVFDGYKTGPSTKDHEHIRRSGNTTADILITLSTEAHKNQEAFLKNENNKKQLIAILTQRFQNEGHAIRNSESDADTLIVATALEYAKNENVTVVADDTDILVLLLYHWRINLKEIFLLSEGDKRKKTIAWNIRQLCEHHGPNVSQQILFIHAWGGCDTTSATYRKGKSDILQRIRKSEVIRKLVKVFGDENSNQKQIGEAGIKLFIMSYNGKEPDSLGKLRYAQYLEMSASATKSIQPHFLPPTERAAYFHSLRVHLQITQWKTLCLSVLEPTKWGWKVEKGSLLPIATDQDPGPQHLLNFIRCKCKVSSKNTCETNICTCRKNGLCCVAACGDCRGENCNNSDKAECDEFDSDESDDMFDDGNIFERLDMF